MQNQAVNNRQYIIDVDKKLCWKGLVWVMDTNSLKWRTCTCQTAPGGFRDCVASFYIPVKEMHLHKVLMRLEGRGGVVN